MICWKCQSENSAWKVCFILEIEPRLDQTKWFMEEYLVRLAAYIQMCVFKTQNGKFSGLLILNF
jgi:hypothetical protein